LDLKDLENGVEPKRFDDLKRPKFKRVNLGRITWEENYENLTDWSKNRVRFHMGGQLLYDIGDPSRNICYTLYRNALEHAGKAGLIDQFGLDWVVQDVKRCQELSAYAKKRGEQCSEDWRYLVDLHRLTDFLPYLEDEEFVSDIKDWVQREPLHTWNGDEEKWYAKFEECFKRVLLRSGRMPGDVISVNDFIRNGDLWCTSGSGFEPEADKLSVTDTVRDATFDVTKNKWSVRWKLSNYKVKKLLFKRRKQICKAVQKSEPGKVRAVISSDLSLYLKMSYVSTFLEKALAGSEFSTLFMSKQARFDLWQSMAKDGTWRMPIDQSEFDKNVTGRQIKISLACIAWFLQYLQAPDVFIELMDMIEYALDGGYVLINGERIDIRNGVLSGWRWTALLDTLINLTEVEMAKDWVEENSTIKVNFLALNAQGDDDWMKLRTRQEGIAIWLALESFGLMVNPGKFFLSKTRDEYLRRVMDKDKITGYPARSVTSICFRNPINEKETVGADRVRQGMNKWKLFCERMDMVFNRSWWWRCWIQDSIQGTRGMTKEIITNWFNTDVVIGGIGYDGMDFQEYDVPSSSILETNDLIIHGEGYDEWVEFASIFGVEKRSAMRFAASTLKIQGGRIPEWVKYIFTYDNLRTEFPHGSDANMKGMVAVGKQARSMARILNIRWFPSMQLLEHSTHYDNWELVQARTYRPLKLHHVYESKAPRLTRYPIISQTLASLSSKPELVYSDYKAFDFSGKPRSWVTDFINGKLKSPSSPRPGWGSDVIGHIAGVLLPTAINQFLNMSKPSMGIWDGLLASINATIPTILNGLNIRVVE